MIQAEFDLHEVVLEVLAQYFGAGDETEIVEFDWSDLGSSCSYGDN